MAVATGFPQDDQVSLLAVMSLVWQITLTTVGSTCGLPPQSVIVTRVAPVPAPAGWLHAERSTSGTSRVAIRAADVLLASTLISLASAVHPFSLPSEVLFG